MQQVHCCKWGQQRTQTGRSLPGREGIGVGFPEDVDSWTWAMGVGVPCGGRRGLLGWVGWRAGPDKEGKGNEVRPGGLPQGLMCGVRE